MSTLTLIDPSLLSLSDQQFAVLSPYFWVIGGVLLLTILSAFTRPNQKYPVFLLSLVILIAGIVAASDLLGGDTVYIFDRMMVSDGYSNFFNVLVLASAFLTILMSFNYLTAEGIQHPEYFVLVLFAAIGMMLMGSSLDLIVIFIALELMSLSVYALVGFRRFDKKSNEAALKYFILGGAASAILLYGAALLYGATATTNIEQILVHIKAHPGDSSPLLVLGIWLVLVGFLFKVAAVPFHMWMPDVYEGAPVPITGFMTTGLKAASFAAFIRVFVSFGYGNGLAAEVQQHLHDIIWICAVLTMVIGNVVALSQVNLKRMLAYSSIAHTGYILVGLLAGSQSEQGYAPILMYLVVYAIMNMGAFVILTVMAGKRDQGLNLHDMGGLAQRHPWLAFCMAVFLFSMAGLPPTAGFVAKYLIFYSAIQAGEILIVVLAVLCSAISVYYYLRVLVYMYMRESAEEPLPIQKSVWAGAALAAMVALTLQIGLLPSQLVELVKRAVTGI